ncbi:hypothetical protein APY03_4266 [Variovorax sp. WDL1]|nr:hypothetical protein APY03_4266 [Variovorax sp. WDL1]
MALGTATARERLASDSLFRIADRALETNEGFIRGSRLSNSAEEHPCTLCLDRIG